MLSGPRWLALEVKALDRVQSFYEAFLDLDVRERADSEVRLAAGETDLVLRAPGSIPRGGLHTHYALSIPAGEYDGWHGRLGERFDLHEETFGDARSLYFYDPEGNCVELGEGDVAGPGVDGCFEVVLEVETLERAEAFYEELGFDPVDRGGDRRRVRMTCGDFDLELWEPHLGIADARGGVHVDLGIATDDAEATAERARRDALAVTDVKEGLRLRDPDGHYVTLVEERE
jgi:catechol-2,3-dioxygenase